MKETVVAAFAAVYFSLLFSSSLVFLFSMLETPVWRVSSSLCYFKILNFRYNERARRWVEEGLESFKGANFSIDDQKLEMDTTTSGKFYPVHDSCSKEGDPAEKCVYTEALYYKTFLPVSSGSSTSVTIMSGKEKLVSKLFENMYSHIYTPSDLNCSKERSKCSSKCHSKGGEWNSATERCTVTYYLNSVCYRVAKDNDKYMLDIPPYVLLLQNYLLIHKSIHYNLHNI